MKTLAKRWLAFVPFLASLTMAAEEQPPRVGLVWTDTPPVIDGVLDDEVWKQAALIDEFVQVLPVPGAPPSQRTEFRLLTDGRELYIGVRCFDDAIDQMIANRMLRDDIYFFDDNVSVVLDPFLDKRNGYYFEVNPRGGRRDVLLEGDATERSWDAIWRAQTTIDENGWSLEVAIPFQSINFDPGTDAWGMNISRGISGSNEEVRWTDPAPQRFITNMGRAGILEGMTGVDQGLGLEIVPTMVVRRIDDNTVDRHTTKIEPSGSLFYKILPSLTASLTANTDFGETEADLRQVNLTRFKLFYPERRDFFLQDALIFDFANLVGNGEPFFSRRIGLTPSGETVPLLFGGKVTGRIGNDYKLGVLNTQVDSYEGVSQQNLSVARGAMNIFGESTLGAIVTHGNPGGGPNNTLVGTDFIYKNTQFMDGKSLNGTAWLQHTFTEGIDDQQMAYGASIAYPNDRVSWLLRFMELQENFNPALGFVNRADIREYEANFRYRIRRTGLLRTIDSLINTKVVTDTDNNLQTFDVLISPVQLRSNLSDVFSPVYRHQYESLDVPFEIHPGVVIPVGDYHFDSAGFRLESSQSRARRGRLLVGGGSFYTGWRLSVWPQLEWRPSHHWLVGLAYEFNAVRLREGDFNVHLVQFRVNVQFTPDVSWITLVQWDNDSESIGINSRLRWIVQDGRELFVVFNQDLDTQNGISVSSTEPLIKLFWTFRF
ncbi:carbohydrate binding family 9 domain-containing protein [Myxococcota bacterium]|nr:carbohydrate binding family 9 domain-containing protein [Myxococcota bacterium]